jgi:hypothetical protein
MSPAQRENHGAFAAMVIRAGRSESAAGKIPSCHPAVSW